MLDHSIVKMFRCIRNALNNFDYNYYHRYCMEHSFTFLSLFSPLLWCFSKNSQLNFYYDLNPLTHTATIRRSASVLFVLLANCIVSNKKCRTQLHAILFVWLCEKHTRIAGVVHLSGTCCISYSLFTLVQS